MLDENRSTFLVFLHSVDGDVVLNTRLQVTESDRVGTFWKVEFCATAFYRG